ncbi:unnamed protein product [Kluyveromyces dobzhanskii CBS 2104]|uniref:WGS project CCBQ000000000 data, contig 00058 n=1 Tax=Kluyveromyces dobzhanskii CBS 2104 TaxID=1427455 RepID=A0A0A8LD95_9SACH|nr:unnamed protein product [Kluyveromyces dobzhanskii CBS 2104]
MANFVVALWESVFQPGTSPQLVVATHISFFLLLCVLGSQIYLTKNIHFIALTVIATLLWITVTWFIFELNSIKLSSNQDLQAAESKKTDVVEDSGPVESETSKETAQTDQSSSTPRKRKTKSRRA